MVINSFSNSSYWNKQGTVSSVQERILAAFLDIILHMPIIYLILAASMRKLNILAQTSREGFQYTLLLSQNIVLMVLSSLILQILYLKFQSATPGKRALKLKVISLDGKPLTWGQCIVRSLVWWIEVATMGLGFLEVVSHPLRRAIHDRAAETIVISLKMRKPTPPLESELVFVRAFLFTFFFAVLGWLAGFVSEQNSRIRNGQIVGIKRLEDQGLLCSQVSDYAERTSINIDTIVDRLDYSTSLFMLNQIDNDCYEREVDYSFTKLHEVNTSYLGRSLLAVKKSVEQKEYIEKTCTVKDSWPCKTVQLYFSDLFNQKDNTLVKNSESLMNDFNSIKEIKLSYKVALMKYFNRVGKYQNAVQVLYDLQNDGMQSTGLIKEHLYALAQFAETDSIKSALMSAKSIVPKEDYFRITAESCLARLNSGCLEEVAAINKIKREEVSCSEFKSLLPEWSHLLSEKTIGRAFIKQSYCSGQVVAQSDYWSQIEDEESQKLLALLFQIKSPKEGSIGITRLRRFVEDTSLSNEIRIDAFQFLMNESHLNSDLKLLGMLKTSIPTQSAEETQVTAWQNSYQNSERKPASQNNQEGGGL